MPTAASIQLLNDANGTAYAFLEDDGYLWQCQWNPEAQRWDKGQIVPGAYGGQDLQALLVDDLWPTDSNGVVGSKPGLVLAYRLGQGAQADVFASLAQWDSEGQLTWSSPVQLSNDQLEDKDLALSAGPAGGFTLVAQKQQTGASLTALIDELKASQNADLSEQLKEAASGERLDSDLIATRFQVVKDPQNPDNGQLVLKNQTTGTSSTALSAAPPAPPLPTTPLAISGNTQISRQQLLSRAPKPPTLQASNPPNSNSLWQGGLGLQKTFNNGGALRFGALLGQALLRWKAPVETNEEIEDFDEVVWPKIDVEKFDPDSDVMTLAWGTMIKKRLDGIEGGRKSVATIVNDAGNIMEPAQGGESALSGAESLLRPFSSDPGEGEDEQPNINAEREQPKKLILGSIGLFNSGAGGPTVVSTFKYLPYTGGDTINSQEIIRNQRNAILNKDSVLVGKGQIQGLAGSLKTTYQYQGRKEFPGLTSLTADESIAYNYESWTRRIKASGESSGILIYSISGAAGVLLSQNLVAPEGEKLPTWLATIGYLGGLAADIEKQITTGRNLTSKGYQNGRLTDRGDINSIEARDNIGTDSQLKVAKANAIAGISIAAVGPAAALVLSLGDSDNLKTSYGLELSGRIGARYLFGGIAGIEASVADDLRYYLFGDKKSTGDNRIFINAGVALPLGGEIPLISYYLNTPFGQNSETRSGVAPEAPESSSATGVYISAGNGQDYPFAYVPERGDASLLSDTTDTATGNPALLGGQASPLRILSLLPSAVGQVADDADRNRALSFYNFGAGLTDGDWTDVAILGVTVDGRSASAAKASFTVVNGSVDPATFQITDQGDYLALPETQVGSGTYGLVLDVFTKGIASTPSPNSAPSNNPLATSPLLLLDSSKLSAPDVLKTQDVQMVSAVPVPKADRTASTVTPSDGRNNSLTTYRQVTVQLFASSAPLTAVKLLAPASDATATVTVSGGSVVDVKLDAPLLFPTDSSNSTYSLQLTLPDGSPLTYRVTPQINRHNNVVADEQYTSQPGAVESGVYLAGGLNDQLIAVPAMGSLPVQNRVAYVRTTGDTSEILYLNGNRRNASGTIIPEGELNPSDLSLEEIYNNPDIVFAAASTPTAVTISSSKHSNGVIQPGAYNGETLVAWVEATDPVIPVTSLDNGSVNYQAFMQALYGNQRINYRISGEGSSFVAPNLDDLYHPDQAIIRDLKAMTVANPASGGRGTLLVWTEVSIPAIKGAIQNISSGDLSMPPPAVIKTVWLNPNASNYQPNELFSNADGSVRGLDAIATIPWTPATQVGLTIEELAIASQPRVQADGSLASTAVVSWSQEVRTPYRQSVLNDQPLLFLPFSNLESGDNAINLGSLQSASTTTFASATGLDFSIAGALPKSNASSVQNTDGTGVLNTGLGTGYRTIRQQLSNVPVSSFASSADPIAQITASIDGTTLSVSAVSSGLPKVGDLLTGAGILAGTRISALIAVDANSGLGTYSIDRSQSLASSELETIAQPVQLPFSSFSGSITGNTLTVSGVSDGTLNVGDIIGGYGVAPRTAIVAIDSFDANSGTGTFQLNTSQNLPDSALMALPGPATAPYSIEFWAQLQPNTNPEGAGLVALGQPTEAAIGTALKPEGWLMNAIFVVEKLTYNEAAAQGLIGEDELANISDPSTATYGWQWTVQATGANTTALNGTGGSNLYSNALLLNNLYSGARLEGVDEFLESYSLSADDLIGIDGTDAATIANVPLTQLDLVTDLDPTSGRPSSSLNGIAFDTSTSLLNQGLVEADGVADTLGSMLDTLWQFQQATGEAKVIFSQGVKQPVNEPAPANQQENYLGYALDFTLSPGIAISVNGNGQLVFDVADGVTLTSNATDSLPADLRDGSWHHIVATYLPDYQPYITSSGVTVSRPSIMGTATLSVDNQLVASQSMVIDAYRPININDQADLLVNNTGGAIDLLAIYDKALTSSEFSPNLSGNWPQPSEQEALEVLKALGYSFDTKTPNQGAISGAITRHWTARTVNPDSAALATYTSYFDAASGAWSEAKPLNAELEIQGTSTSFNRRNSLQDALIISIPANDWTQIGWTTSINGTTKDNQFWDPAGKQLSGVKVSLTNLSDTSQAPATIILTSDQVLLGRQTLSSIQQQNGAMPNGSVAYTFLSNEPSLRLLIPKDQLPASTGQGLADMYSATYSFEFTEGGTVTTVTAATPVVIDTAGYSVGTVTTNQNSRNTINGFVQSNSKAIATADVLEAAPLQLKYIDSGWVLKSATTPADANNTAVSSPANSFGQSQVFGFFNEGNDKQSWLAVAQPFSTNALSNPAGRVWIQYTGQSTDNQPSDDPNTAPNTWLNALARSNFAVDRANLPLLGDAEYPSEGGGLLIQADPTNGWGQNFGQTMLVADVNGDTTSDLIIAAPQADGGGRVVIIDGSWIKANLIKNTGATILNLSNPNEFGQHVTVLKPVEPSSLNDDIAVANFGQSLAFDSKTRHLWVGAPNYLRQLDTTNPSIVSLQAIGALYAYNPTDIPNSWGSGLPTALSPKAFGSGGTTTTLDADGSSQNVSYWGSQLGTSIAINGQGDFAVSAPGVQASLLYSGTEVVQQQAGGNKNPNEPYGDGALIKLQLPVQPSDSGQLPDVSSFDGTRNSLLLPVANQIIDSYADYALADSSYMLNLQQLQKDAIAPATYLNNQAIQTGAVGAVYLLKNSSSLLSEGKTINAQSIDQNSGATFYGALPWNTLGDSGFGTSLAFSDLNNTNNASVLAIGAPQTGGSGAVYLIDTAKDFTAAANNQPSWMKSINIINEDNKHTNQYLAYLASSLTMYGDAIGDNLGSGLTNLGDVNDYKDSSHFDDLLISGYNAASGAGIGYVLFGDDNLIVSSNTGVPIPATGSVAPSLIGQINRANGDTINTAILRELGHGANGYTGQGTFGNGDIDGDGINDIPLGSGSNGESYITKGQLYLNAINSLALQKLASDTGYILDGLATTTQGSLRSIGDFNGDGYGDFVSILPGTFTDTVRIELGANTEEILADYPYNFYTFQVAPGTQVLHAGDTNGDGYSDIALFLQQNLSTTAEGNAGAGSTTGILYGRPGEQLPLGSGFGLLAPVDESSAPLASLTSQQVSGAFSTKAPAMLAVGNTIYAVWVGEGTGSTNLWFAESRDGGQTWLSPNGSNNSGYAATKLTAYVPDIASSQTPSLAWFNDKLYLGFVNQDNQLAITSWDPSSGNTTLWGNPKVLTEAGSPLTSNLTPSLISDGTYLSVIWVDPDTNTLQGSTTSTPDLSRNGGVLSAGGPTGWSWVPNGQSPESPALANDGTTVYMAHHGENNQLYWTSSSDGGQSWRAWQQLPDFMKTDNAPSLAIVNQDLFIIYKGYEYDSGSDDQRIHISKLEDVGTNQWSNPAILGQTARDGLGLAAINERVNNSEGLAIYYVANNDTGTILRTWSDQPLDNQSWQSQTTLNTSSGGNQTASGALAVTRFNNQTYLAYQGGTPKSASTVAYITTASNPSLSASWEAVANRNTGNQRGIGLSSDDTGLLLNTTDTGFDTYKQSIYRYDLTGTSGWSFYTNNDSVDDTAKTAALLALPSSGSTPQLLLAAANPGSSDRIETSVYYPLALNNSWISPTPLKERLVDSDGTPFPGINATAAVTTTLLNGTPVLAVNNSGVISIYTSNGSKTFSLASSFNTGGDGSTAAGITTTESGLALSYRNSDGTVSLQRLNFLQLDGTPVDGVVFNADGSLDTSNANLQWQEVKLGANNGLSTGLDTAPLSANGMLLLGSTNNGNQVQLNAIPSLGNPDSTTWLNSTVQLPDGQGGWTLQQQATGSSLSAVGDLTADGYADLLVTTGVVQADGTSKTGLRLISGAATSSQILAINDATASSQTVQVAESFGGNRSTPVATLSGTIGGQPQLTLSSTDSSTGAPYSLSTSFGLDDFRATAGDLASAHTAFSSAAAPMAEGPGLGLGFGDLSLNTSGSYGDLNADGYRDSLEGSATTVYGADGLGWHVWSIRAAGDANGNGTDDVLLSLVPPETVLNGAPQWIQPVLVDGALFEVDTATNSFSLNRMRRALNPNGRLQLEDINSTSSTQPWPLLQNWLQPILDYQHTQQNSFHLVPNRPEAELPIDVYGSVSDDSGMIYLFSSNKAYDASAGDRVAITKYDPYTGTILWHSTLPDSIKVTANINANTAIIYYGSLYFLDNALSLHAIKANILTEDSVGDPNNWTIVNTPSSLPKRQVVDQLAYGGSIVNEGDRIGLYYVGYGDPDNDQFYNLVYAYSQPQLGGSGKDWQPGTDYGGLIKTTDGKPTYVQVNHGTGTGGEVPNTRNTVATRFNGETYVAYVNNYTNKDTYNIVIVRRPEPAGGGDSDAWKFSASIEGNPKYLRLDANQTQLLLSSLVDGGYGYSRVYAFNDFSNQPIEQSIYGESGFQIDTETAFMVGSQLTFVDFGDNGKGTLRSIATPWNGVVQQSLAGYSVDGNIDVNGDGFMDMLVSDPSDPSKNVDNQYALFGGDYLNIASQVGTPGNDVMLGTTLADVIYSIQGADQVFSNGGKDVIYTGAGDDAISIKDNAFIRIDAGSGFDQLLLEGLANQSYDFRLNVPDPEYFAGTKLRDIELISSLDYGANALSFDAAAINAINADRVLFLVPDAADSIALSTEFSRNTNFDTSYGGTLWSAYAAAPASATPATANPALLYVATPTGQTADWLGSHVSTSLTAVAAPAANLRAAAAAPADPLGSLPKPSAIAGQQTFGDGLTLLAYRSDPASGVARFAIERSDTRTRQVVAYASSSANSSAEPGRHYSPVAGLLVFEPGESRQEVTVSINAEAMAALRGGSLSLEVEELTDRGHKPLHLLLEPQTPASGGSAPPALSGFSLTPGSNGEDATLRFRADSNAGTGALESLRLSVSRRRSADSNAIETSQILDILDARPGNGQTPAAYDAVPGTLALDNDQLANRQIATQLELLFTAADGEPSVRLAAPALAWQSTLLLADDLTLQFSQDTPFTLWRADNGTAPVTFGLQAGSQSLTLLNDATGGSSGSINPQNALNSDPLTGWLASEGLAVGSRTVVSGLPLSGITWTPTASSNGQQLALLDLNQEGNQITARFSGGITAVFGLQGTGQAPSPTPILPAVEVQRLAGYDNALAFYALDSVTGMVDGINPGEAGYLQKALARSEASGLLLSAGDLPAYGASRSYTDLPLDHSRSYGALLLVNGDRSRLYSSFAAANPGGVAQMINLGNSRTGLVLGFEDLPATSGDADYNDLVVNIANVSVPVF